MSGYVPRKEDSMYLDTLGGTHIQKHQAISRAGRFGWCTRFCVKYACSIRKVQGSSPNGGKIFSFSLTLALQSLGALWKGHY